VCQRSFKKRLTVRHIIAFTPKTPYTIYMLIRAFLILLLLSSAAAANGLVVQSYDGTPSINEAQPRAAAPALRQLASFTTQQKPEIPYGPPPWYKPPAEAFNDPNWEYTGYQNRNAIAAFYACRIDAMRTAVPGDSSKGLLEQVRIRKNMMDICMAREGFFPSKNKNILNTGMVTLRDFLW
jgi:hypothetical protein